MDIEIRFTPTENEVRTAFSMHIHAGPISLEVGVEVWTEDQWQRDDDRPPDQEVVWCPGGTRIRIGPREDHVHGPPLTHDGAFRVGPRRTRLRLSYPG